MKTLLVLVLYSVLIFLALYSISIAIPVRHTHAELFPWARLFSAALIAATFLLSPALRARQTGT